MASCIGPTSGGRMGIVACNPGQKATHKLTDGERRALAAAQPGNKHYEKAFNQMPIPEGFWPDRPNTVGPNHRPRTVGNSISTPQEMEQLYQIYKAKPKGPSQGGAA